MLLLDTSPQASATSVITPVLAQPCKMGVRTLSYLDLVPTHNLPLAVDRFLDGRVWPLEDELEVRLMIDLIRHVTGAAPLPMHCTLQASSNSCYGL